MAIPAISPADRIRDLSAIDAEIAEMLQSASEAINSLTDRPLLSENGDDTQMENGSDPDSLEKRKAVFAEHTQGYYTHLQAIVARLRRQAYALEEAGIIAPEAPILASSAQQRQANQGTQRGQAAAVPASESERITNGGLGNLDIGWLNSRGNKVGSEKEKELIDETKKLLEEHLKTEQEAAA